MTYANIYGQSMQQQFQPAASSVQSIFQPGFAGTNVQEVRAQNAAAASPYQQPTYHVPAAFGASAVFQPGFAGTNVQEVRALNAGYPAPAASQQSYAQAYQPQQAFLAQQAYQPQQQAFQPQQQVLQASPINAIFQPGFAGTNPQEVRQDYMLSQQNYGQTFQPQQAFLSQQAFQGQQQNRPIMGSTVSSIFQPGFAGTNPQEVRQDYALSQQSIQPGLLSYRAF